MNFGITFFIIAGLVLILAALILLIYCLCRNQSKCSHKNRERIQKLKDKVLYNPFIKYSYVNCLKINMAGLMALSNFDNESINQRIVAIAVIALISLLPLLFARILCKHAEQLDSEA